MTRAADGRLFHDMTDEDLARLARSRRLEIVEAWRSTPKLRGTNEADWNNLIARKPR
jgi:hypothetical protein